MYKFLFPLCLSLFIASAPLQAQSSHPNQADIDKLLQRSQLPSDALTFVALPLNGPRKGINYNADASVNPASVMKLVTTYAALESLGPTFTWKTELLTDGNIQGDQLNGNLYFRSGGDPKLTTERLWLLLRDLKLQGVRHINGNLVLDGSYYDIQNLTAFDGDQSDLYRPFMVEPDGLLINFNAQRFIVKADDGRASIVADPLVPEVIVDNQIKVTPAKSCHTNTQLYYQPRQTAERLSLTVSGSIPEGCKAERYFAFIDHARYASGVIRSTWQDMGGSLSGSTLYSSTPKSAKLLSSLPSAPVVDIIRDINKFSNNTLAKQLFLTMGAHFRTPQDPDDVIAARRAIGNWWLSLGITQPQLIIDNGSGLSRQERITANELALMLKSAASSRYAAEFQASLPLVAVDGTMRRRLRGHPIAGQARIKTGTLRNVRAIAGYTKDKDGHDWVVVAILNHPRNLNNAILDSLLGAVYSQTAVR